MQPTTKCGKTRPCESMNFPVFETEVSTQEMYRGRANWIELVKKWRKYMPRCQEMQLIKAVIQDQEAKEGIRENVGSHEFSSEGLERLLCQFFGSVKWIGRGNVWGQSSLVPGFVYRAISSCRGDETLTPPSTAPTLFPLRVVPSLDASETRSPDLPCRICSPRSRHASW